MQKKVAYVLSGGGARGAFQAGVLAQLNKNNITPDIIYGTSVGALNGSVSGYGSIDTVLSNWTSLKKRSDVLTFNWKILLLMGDGLLIMKKLRKNYIDKLVTGVPKCEVQVCRVNLLNGRAEYISNLTHTINDFRDAVQDSCTIPLFMEPRSNYMDGGLREVIPISKAIEDGCTEIHVITCNPWTDNPPAIPSIKKKCRFARFYPFLQRSVDDVMNHDVKYNDLYIAYLLTKDNPNITIKVYQSDFIISSTLEFSPEKIKRGIEHGYQVTPVLLKTLFE